MWDKLEKQIRIEREALNRAIETHRPLLSKVCKTPPDPIETSALGSLLHSFYTGIENLFKRITLEFDDPLPQGEMWHVRLLDSMTAATASRPAVVSVALAQRLRLYLDFRHVFRHAYPFELRWAKMAPLVMDCEATLRALEADLDRFVQGRKDDGIAVDDNPDFSGGAFP